MEPIDAASQKLIEIIHRIDQIEHTIISEQDTRLKVINPILTDVLGWPVGEIFTEENARPGFVDYKLTVNGFSRLIVEAKRDSRALGTINRNSGSAYKLSGPVFHTEAAKEGIAQAIAYCGQKNAELACVTNGQEWIIFRGSRLGDGKDTLDGMAYLFTSLSEVRKNFPLFYNLLSYEEAMRFTYRAYFQEVEGRIIRTHNIRKALRTQNSRKLLNPGPLSSDLDRIMTSFFRRLTGDSDPDLLSKCFVVTRESHQAEERIARISEDLVNKIKDLDTDSGEQLTDLIDRVKSTQRNEFVIIVGTKGAGKTTFIDRFFKFILPKKLLDECIIARVNVADSDGSEKNVVDWLDNNLLQVLETSLFNDQSPTYDEVQGMFFDEYQRRSTGSLKFLYEKNREDFKIDFGLYVEKIREDRPHDYMKRLVRHIARSRKKVPCLVFDNADHFTIEFQERIFQYARSIYESEICLVIMPITDRTSWQLSREGALRSFESESLFLPTPQPSTVLQKRISFFEEKLLDERKESGRGYFFSRGISLSVENLTSFGAVLQSVFLNTGDTALWIGNLANRDIRKCLEIAKNLVTSAHIEVHELMKAYISSSSMEVKQWKIRRALIKGGYDIYPEGVNSFVHNVYALDNDSDSTPLLGLRILKLLRDAQDSGDEKSVTVDQITDYFRAMQIDSSITYAWLNRMLEKGLCLNYDPTVISVFEASRIEISPSGLQHLLWGLRESNYIQAMMEVTPLMDLAVFDQLSGLSKQPRSTVWKAEIESFINYLITEDSKYCSVPDHQAYLSQKKLPIDLKQAIQYI
jgi:AAA domain